MEMDLLNVALTKSCIDIDAFIDILSEWLKLTHDCDVKIQVGKLISIITGESRGEVDWILISEFVQYNIESNRFADKISLEIIGNLMYYKRELLYSKIENFVLLCRFGSN